MIFLCSCSYYLFGGQTWTYISLPWLFLALLSVLTLFKNSCITQWSDADTIPVDKPVIQSQLENNSNKATLWLFADMAIGCPYGGDNRQGLVLIYNGCAEGLMNLPTQTLVGQWAFSSFPASFGFALRGNKDVDQNGYPGTESLLLSSVETSPFHKRCFIPYLADLVVGAFGVDKAVLYRYVEINWGLNTWTVIPCPTLSMSLIRARPIVSARASLTVHPTVFTYEEKNCELEVGTGNIPVSW